MHRNEIGQAGLSGWRTRLADAVATPVARRTAMSEGDVRAVVGAALLALSLLYVAGVIRRLARDG